MIERSNFKAKRKIPFVAQAVGSVGLAFAAISPTCAGSEDNNTKPIGESDNQPNLGYAYKFPWADDETWYLTGGPHADGLSNGVLYAEDFAVLPKEKVWGLLPHYQPNL